MSTLADFVKVRRKELGLSLSRLGMRANLSKGYLHDIEKGQTANLTVGSICAIAAALQIDAIRLFCIAAEITPPGDTP